MIWIRMICHISIKAFMMSYVSIINELIQVFGKGSFMDVKVSTHVCHINLPNIRYCLSVCLSARVRGWEPLAVTLTKLTFVCTLYLKIIMNSRPTYLIMISIYSLI